MAQSQAAKPHSSTVGGLNVLQIYRPTCNLSHRGAWFMLTTSISHVMNVRKELNKFIREKVYTSMQGQHGWAFLFQQTGLTLKLLSW
jgi:hypothetical protein